jgi:hypothetical protein
MKQRFSCCGKSNPGVNVCRRFRCKCGESGYFQSSKRKRELNETNNGNGIRIANLLLKKMKLSKA